MAYLIVYKNWLPYNFMSDKRGFISKKFGGGHTGVDSVGNQVNNPVCAVINGKVLSVTKSGTLGNCVEYGNNKVKIAYYHLKSVNVISGQEVKAGVTNIGIEGSTGSLATGKHLHTSMWIDGVLVDPEQYMAGKKDFPKETTNTNVGGNVMIRKAIRSDLNVRAGAGVSNSSYGKIKINSNFFVYDGTQTKTSDGATWAKVTAELANGKSITGWSNIGSTWSKQI